MCVCSVIDIYNYNYFVCVISSFTKLRSQAFKFLSSFFPPFCIIYSRKRRGKPGDVASRCGKVSPPPPPPPFLVAVSTPENKLGIQNLQLGLPRRECSIMKRSLMKLCSVYPSSGHIPVAKLAETVLCPSFGLAPCP